MEVIVITGEDTLKVELDKDYRCVFNKNYIKCFKTEAIERFNELIEVIRWIIHNEVIKDVLYDRVSLRNDIYRFL